VRAVARGGDRDVGHRAAEVRDERVGLDQIVGRPFADEVHEDLAEANRRRPRWRPGRNDRTSPGRNDRTSPRRSGCTRPRRRRAIPNKVRI